ncbi:MAG: alpha/beta hydrolase, partial [Bradyrhizobium sp.]
MPDALHHSRRRFVTLAGTAIAAFQLGSSESSAQTFKTASTLPAIRPGTTPSFAPLKQITAGELSIGYAEAGPADGPVVILLHGWPYDIHSFADVAPALAAAGHR